MKRIVLLCSGQRYRWEDLTGMPHPQGQNEGSLRILAASAQEIDPQITGFELVDEKDEPRPARYLPGGYLGD